MVQEGAPVRSPSLGGDWLGRLSQNAPVWSMRLKLRKTGVEEEDEEDEDEDPGDEDDEGAYDPD